MRHGAGQGRTRDDHLAVAAQLVAAMARARDARQFAELVGDAALTGTDRRYLDFAAAVTEELISQPPAERREMEDSLGRARSALAVLPVEELTMIPSSLVERYRPSGRPGATGQRS